MPPGEEKGLANGISGAVLMIYDDELKLSQTLFIFIRSGYVSLHVSLEENLLIWNLYSVLLSCFLKMNLYQTFKISKPDKTTHPTTHYQLERLFLLDP